MTLASCRRGARDPRSRLGWRIALELDPPAGFDARVTRVLEEGLEFAHNLPDGFSETRLPHAESIGVLIAGDEIPPEDQAALETATGLDIERIRGELALDHDVGEETEETADPDAPTIVCSTMVSAKGLSAEHVFIVGFNNEHFPRHPDAITDYEICCLLVALSRTRKQCHVVSCGRWKGQPVDVSAFLGWLGVSIEGVRRDAAYWQANPPK
jgi:superfamily I DNA/RNA helicase